MLVFVLPLAFLLFCALFLWNWSPGWLDPRLKPPAHAPRPGGVPLAQRDLLEGRPRGRVLQHGQDHLRPRLRALAPRLRGRRPRRRGVEPPPLRRHAARRRRAHPSGEGPAQRRDRGRGGHDGGRLRRRAARAGHDLEAAGRAQGDARGGEDRAARARLSPGPLPLRADHHPPGGGQLREDGRVRLADPDHARVRRGEHDEHAHAPDLPAAAVLRGRVAAARRRAPGSRGSPGRARCARSRSWSARRWPTAWSGRWWCWPPC